MNRKRWFALIAAIVAISVLGTAPSKASRRLASAKAGPAVVVFDSATALEVAEAICNEVAQRPDWLARAECAAEDPRLLGRRLEEEIQARMAANPKCRGVTAVRGRENFDDHVAFDKTPIGRYWELSVRIRPGSDAIWWMTLSDIADATIGGEGTPEAIADAVCTAAPSLTVRLIQQGPAPRKRTRR